MKFLASILFVILGGCYASSVLTENCTIISDVSGFIEDKLSTSNEERCWLFEVPKDGAIVLNVRLQLPNYRTTNGLEITAVETNRTVTYKESSINFNIKVSYSNVKIVHFVRGGYSYYTSKFAIEYKIVRGVLAVDGTEESLKNGISWIKKQRAIFWGWKDNTVRAVVALYLANGVRSIESDLDEELMAKETDVRTSVTLLRNSITDSELSMIINALLVTCHNPHHFYGNNLVKRLKTGVKTTRNFTHPIAYLALCNAGETWPAKAIDELNRILNRHSDYHFVEDIKAMAVMALSCMINRGENVTDVTNTSILYEDAIKRFKESQLQDGSFGNAHSTALITQAMIASGQENSKDWNLRSAVRYLMTTMASPSADFLTAYLTLPVLNAKTLADISKIDCSDSLRKHGDDTVSEMYDSLGLKIHVKYSLYFGDKKDITQSISLKVPENFTAYEVMERAANQDPRYKFEEKRIFGKIYVYKIANVTNDSENGKFWLMNIWTSKLTMEPVTNGPDELIMKDGQHLVMWYKTMYI